ncbi:MAG: glutathione S-transferase [Granulosicoccus sp.]|nr:glutathione S-transferase [Granulosicoccus sp.]
MKLFGHPDSGHAFKVRLFLQVAGINHDYEYVDIHQPREQRSAEFREHARYGEVPLLIDGGKAYVQSNAILLYLCQQFGRWGGEDADTFNACAEWLLWEANKTGLCLPQLRSFHKGDADAALEAAIPWLKARYEHDINVLEAEFSDGREWIIGSQAPSIADFSLCGYLVFADEAQVAVPANVSAWLDRLTRLEGWQHPYQLLATD